jgi:hypothetical protein
MDRKEIKNIFRTAAKNHGLRSRAARYYLIIGDMHVLCILYHSNFGDGVFIDIRVEPSDGRNNSVAFAEMIYLMYRIAGYDCPHADIIWKLELDSTNISVNETCMIAEWTMSHIKAQWSSLDVIATKVLDQQLHRQAGMLVTTGMIRWATDFLASCTGRNNNRK